MRKRFKRKRREIRNKPEKKTLEMTFFSTRTTNTTLFSCMPVKSLVVQIIVSHADESHFYRSKTQTLIFILRVRVKSVKNLRFNISFQSKTKESIG